MIRQILAISVLFSSVSAIASHDINCELTLKEGQALKALKVTFRSETDMIVSGAYDSKLLPNKLDDIIKLAGTAEEQAELLKREIYPANSEATTEILRETKTGLPISVLRGSHSFILKGKENTQLIVTDIIAMLKSDKVLLEKDSKFKGEARLWIKRSIDGKNMRALGWTINTVPISCENYTNFTLEGAF